MVRKVRSCGNARHKQHQCAGPPDSLAYVRTPGR
ncbi:unnamed protein product [Chondrus crispus]|uniref:Uncharacterized protein n=1 Tax=Chondrus crispus TaxID=2769 RepID=R7QLY1_CHOCR|nr:unnamed protein product [Chondrus crispus]CDF38405.1 unnamed protein product [Chondrus crispus]|eukprot:XP_005718298.1 unnamed protein product [Chondrus crispus]